MAETSSAEGARGPGYPSIIPYLLVVDAARLVKFLEEGFGGQRRFIAPSPSGGIMHGEVSVGDGLVMLSDAAETPGTGHFCHYVADVDGVYTTALAAGATSLSAPETKHYGDRVAGIVDPTGNTWWICARLG